MREAERAAAAAVPTVSVAEGEPLPNINIFAGRPDPVCQSLDKYPAWLDREVDRPAKLDPHRFQKAEKLPTRTELRLLNKARIRGTNSDKGV